MQDQALGAAEREAYLFDSFEVSVRTRVLLHDGERLRIQELPFQMLLVLLETPGEIVSKEQLGKRLWGQDTFVEVDKSLYVIAGKLRDALGDDATQPRFIRTVAGRGYRFVGELTPVADLPLPLPPDTPERAPARFRSQRLAPSAGAAAILLAAFGLVLCLGFFLYRYEHRVLASEQDRIVFGGFANGTGNPDLDQTLSSAMQVKLQESPYLSLIPEPKFRALVNDPESAPLADELTACESLGGQVLLRGGITTRAAGYEILLSAWACTSHRLLSKQTADATSQANILSALDIAIDKMRRRLGEPESSLQRFNIPLDLATTGSLAALKAFTLGEQKRSLGDDEGAVPNYKLAIDLDPQFALAYARLGAIDNNASRHAASQADFRKAFELKNHASDREKLYILTHYYQSVTGEIQRTIDDYQIWRSLYPREVAPVNNLAVEYLAIGQPQQALALAHTAVQLDPSNELPYVTLGFAYLKLGDYADLNQLCKDSFHQTTNSMRSHRLCYRASFAMNDEAGMQQQLHWAAGKPEESEALNDAAWVATYRGQMTQAHHLFAQALQAAALAGSAESVTAATLDQASLEADLGDLSAARQEVQPLLLVPFDSALDAAETASILARTNDTKAAIAAAKDAAAMAPLDTLVNAGELAAARAQLHLQQHDARAAVQALEETRPWDFCSEMKLSPPYYRGLAYLQDQKPQQAIIEFQRVIDHASLADFPVYVELSELEQGHAYMLLGDKAKAAPLFTTLERLWSHADQGFPLLKRLHAYEALDRSTIAAR